MALIYDETPESLREAFKSKTTQAKRVRPYLRERQKSTEIDICWNQHDGISSDAQERRRNILMNLRRQALDVETQCRIMHQTFVGAMHESKGGLMDPLLQCAEGIRFADGEEFNEAQNAYSQLVEEENRLLKFNRASCLLHILRTAKRSFVGCLQQEKGREAIRQAFEGKTLDDKS